MNKIRLAQIIRQDSSEFEELHEKLNKKHAESIFEFMNSFDLEDLK